MTDMTRAAQPSRVSTSVSNVPKNGHPVDSVNASEPFRSLEALDAYCHEVQARLIEHAVQRRHLLQEAYDRLSHLLRAAQAVGDMPLYHELWQHCLTVRELLDALHLNEVQADNASTPGAPDSPLFLHSEAAQSGTIHQNAVVADSPRSSSATPNFASKATLPADPAVLHGPLGNGVASTPRLPRRAARPLPDIEADAIHLRMELIDEQTHLLLRTADGSLDIPNCLHLRAIACLHRRLEVEAGDTEVAEVTELGNDISRILTAANDSNYTIARDYEIEPRPTAYQWGELADRYTEMAHAQAAFLWWRQYEAELSITILQPVAESVAAIQQRFNRLLFRLGTRDPFQQQLFDDLRAWAREAQCYLHSLRPKVPIAELVDRASALEQVWENAREALKDQGNEYTH